MRFALLLLASAAFGAEYRLTVSGLGGEPDYELRFTGLAQDTAKYSGAEILSGPTATKDALKAAIARVAAQSHADDTFTLTLIGHGTFDGMVYKFNVPGPDVSAEDLRAWLDKVPAKQLVVVSTSCSGAAATVLKTPNRAVVTATKSGTEKNAVVFGRYWVEAMRDSAADADKSDSVSAQEAFNYAKQKTAAFYETQKRLATEHPLMDDSGLGTRFTLVRFGAAQRALNDPEKRLMLARKEELESAIDRLKLEKAATPLAEYKQKLSALLVELAKIQEELDK